MAEAAIAGCDSKAVAALTDELLAVLTRRRPAPNRATIAAALATVIAASNADRAGPLGQAAGTVVPVTVALLAVLFGRQIDAARETGAARAVGRIQ